MTSSHSRYPDFDTVSNLNRESPDISACNSQIWKEDIRADTVFTK